MAMRSSPLHTNENKTKKNDGERGRVISIRIQSSNSAFENERNTSFCFKVQRLHDIDEVIFEPTGRLTS